MASLHIYRQPHTITKQTVRLTLRIEDVTLESRLCTPITLIEVLRGIETKKRPKVKQLLAESFNLLSIDNKTVETYCTLCDNSKRKAHRKRLPQTQHPNKKKNRLANKESRNKPCPCKTPSRRTPREEKAGKQATLKLRTLGWQPETFINFVNN
jgi:hypothetical protein